MRKPQIQPSFITLSEAEREQLADWLRHEEYDAVFQRVTKPRPEGFGLTIASDKPLRTFYAKVALLDLINARLPENKRFTLAQFECLASADIYLLTSAEQEKVAAVHDQILRTTADLASTSKSATELATLQRLADFPARAAIREQLFEIRAGRIQIERNKEQRAQAKEERAKADAERAKAKADRDAEMHTHKIALDLRKQNHKEETHTFRKEIAAQRLALSERALNLREATAKKSRRSRFALLNHESAPDSVDQQPGRFPNLLPPEVREQNSLYRDKLDSGEIKLIFIENQPSRTEYCNPADKPYFARDLNATFVPDAARASYLPGLKPFEILESPAPSDAKEIPSVTDSTLNVQLPTTANNREQNPVHPAKNPPSARSAPSALISLADLAARVDRYTVNRMREYIAHDQRYTPWPHRHSPPKYTTEFRHCPCGNPTPCPIHETEELGPFPPIFWNLSPLSLDYEIVLREHNLPYRRPTEYIA